jgi:hypothetical protein
LRSRAQNQYTEPVINANIRQGDAYLRIGQQRAPSEFRQKYVLLSDAILMYKRAYILEKDTSNGVPQRIAILDKLTEASKQISRLDDRTEWGERERRLTKMQHLQNALQYQQESLTLKKTSNTADMRKQIAQSQLEIAELYEEQADLPVNKDKPVATKLMAVAKQRALESIKTARFQQDEFPLESATNLRRAARFFERCADNAMAQKLFADANNLVPDEEAVMKRIEDAINQSNPKNDLQSMLKAALPIIFKSDPHCIEQIIEMCPLEEDSESARTTVAQVCTDFLSGKLSEIVDKQSNHLAPEKVEELVHLFRAVASCEKLLKPQTSKEPAEEQTVLLESIKAIYQSCEPVLRQQYAKAAAGESDALFSTLLLAIIKNGNDKAAQEFFDTELIPAIKKGDFTKLILVGRVADKYRGCFRGLEAILEKCITIGEDRTASIENRDERTAMFRKLSELSERLSIDADEKNKQRLGEHAKRLRALSYHSNEEK